MRHTLAALTLASMLACEPAKQTAATGSQPAFLAGLDPAGGPFTGAIHETIAAGGYLYQNVIDADGNAHWVVSLRRDEIGHRVRVRPFGRAHDFVSKKTGRTFDSLIFAIVTPEE